MKRTLLTGFGAFGDIANNPSQRLVEHFANSGAPGHVLTTHVFPVSFTRVEQQLTSLLGESGSVPFDIVLMIGVNAGERDWRIERLGANVNEPGSVDMDNDTAPSGPIIPEMPHELECTFPVEQLVEALHEAAIPAVVSRSAGGYLCNHLLFRALARLQQSPEVIGGFVHIPADQHTFAQASDAKPAEYPSFATHVLAIETILHELRVMAR